MKKRLKKLKKFAFLLTMAVAFSTLVLILFLSYLIRTGDFQRYLVAEMERRTQLRVALGQAGIGWDGAVGITFRDFALFEGQSNRPIFTAEKVLVRISLLPLIRQRIVVSELRFRRPTVRVSGGSRRGFSPQGFVLGLLSQKSEKATFAVDLHEVRIENGEMQVYQRGSAGKTSLTKISEVDLDLRRMEPGGVVTRVAGEAGSSSGANGSMALRIKLSARIEKNEERTKVWANGKMLLPEELSRYERYVWNMELGADRLSSRLLSLLTGKPDRFSSWQGSLAPEVHLDGSVADGIQIAGGTKFRDLELGIQGRGQRRLSLGSGSVSGRVRWAADEIHFPELALQSGGITLSAWGTVRSVSREDPYIDVRVFSPSFPTTILRESVLLASVPPSPWTDWLKALHEGEYKVHGAQIQGRLSEIVSAQWDRSGAEIRVDVEVRDLGGDLPGDRYFPIRSVSGRINLHNDVVRFDRFRGRYGASNFEEVEGRLKGIFSRQKSLDLRVRGELKLDQLQEQLQTDLFPTTLREAASGLKTLTGEGSMDVSVRTDFESFPLLEGTVALRDAGFALGDVSLSEIRGNLTLAPGEIRGWEVTASLAESPLELQILVKDYLSQRGSFDVRLRSPGVPAGEVGRILLGASPAQKNSGLVRGQIRYRGAIASAGNREFTGAVELVRVKLQEIIPGQPLHEVNGSLKFDKTGVDLSGLRVRAESSRFNVQGQWRYGVTPPLTLTVSSADADLDHLLPKDEIRQEWYNHLVARGKIAVKKGRYEGFNLTDLTADVMLEKRHWKLENFVGRSDGGLVRGRGVFVDLPDGLSFSVEPTVEGIPVQELLRWFDGETTDITGKVHLAGKLGSEGKNADERERKLSGNFGLRIEDGIIRRLSILVRILNLLDLSRWFSLKMPDLTQQGIRFRSITADIEVQNGVYSTKNLLVDSDDLRISGAGQWDGPEGQMDFVVAVRPFPKISSTVGSIPLIGSGIAAVKDALLVASFRIKGPVADPTITPAPLSTLSEFLYGALAIPKSLIGIPKEEKP